MNEQRTIEQRSHRHTWRKTGARGDYTWLCDCGAASPYAAPGTVAATSDEGPANTSVGPSSPEQRPSNPLVDRLREAHPFSPQYANGSMILSEAADEIERLTAELAEAIETARHNGTANELNRAENDRLRAALEYIAHPRGTDPGLVEAARKALAGAADETGESR